MDIKSVAARPFSPCYRPTTPTPDVSDDESKEFVTKNGRRGPTPTYNEYVTDDSDDETAETVAKMPRRG